MEPTSTLFQAGPVIASDNDQAKKYVRWKDDEEKAICELLKSQWEVEKASNSDTLDGTKFWPLISEKLKESGIDKTSEQCRRYWHGIIRHQPEFKDTLQFQSRNSTPAPMSNTGTNNIHGAQHLGVESRLRNDTPASMSESRTDNIPGDIGTKDTPGAMSQVDSANGEGRYYWTEDETQKLKELVLANRSSNPKDQQKVSEEFWTLISKQLETYNIHRTWLACRRRFNRICGNQVFPTKQDIIPHSDDSLPNLYEPKADIVEDGDTGYMDQDQDQDDEPSPRRGDRKRMSRPPWTDEEHNRLVQLLKARRELEDKDESLEKLSNNKLFTLVSKQLKQYLIEKSAGACTLYWSSKGFLRSGFDINSPALYQSGRDFRTPSALPALSPVGKDIAEAFSRLPQQHFDDSSIVRGFRKENIVRPAADKRPRGVDGVWEVNDSDDEPIIPAKRRRSAGDVVGNKENIETATTTAPDMLGSAPGMVKRRAPKRDPSLQLFKPSGQNTGSTENNSTRLNPLGEAGQSAESVMKRKIQDLQGQISSLRKKKQKTMSEIQPIEPEILILHNKIEFLQAQKQKLQQSKTDKEAQIDLYSSEIEDLASKKKTLEDALDIFGGRF